MYFVEKNSEHLNFSILYHFLSVFQISNARTQTIMYTSYKVKLPVVKSPV